MKERFESERADHHFAGRVRLQKIIYESPKNYKMGKLNMGILGGFSGTVGTVIGSSNKKGEDFSPPF